VWGMNETLPNFSLISLRAERATAKHSSANRSFAAAVVGCGIDGWGGGEQHPFDEMSPPKVLSRYLLYLLLYNTTKEEIYQPPSSVTLLSTILILTI